VLSAVGSTSITFNEAGQTPNTGGYRLGQNAGVDLHWKAIGNRMRYGPRHMGPTDSTWLSV